MNLILSERHQVDLLDEHEDLFWVYYEEQCFWMKFHSRDAHSAKEAQCEDNDGTSMILDIGCTKAMCSRHAWEGAQVGSSTIGEVA